MEMPILKVRTFVLFNSIYQQEKRPLQILCPSVRPFVRDISFLAEQLMLLEAFYMFNSRAWQPLVTMTILLINIMQDVATVAFCDAQTTTEIHEKVTRQLRTKL